MRENEFLRVENVSMTFPGVKALEDVQLDIRKGEVHALMGENGAGKSTLIKIIAGTQKPDAGSRLFIQGKETGFMDVSGSIQAGINTIFQDLCLFPNLTVAENICIGYSDKKRVSWKQMSRTAQQALDRLGVDIKINEQLGRLSVAKQQLVAIARATSHNCKMLIMDEPTATLSFKEVEVLYGIIDKLKQEGIAILFISHKLDEVFRVADRVTVLRDGKYIGCEELKSLTEADLVKMMVGRSVEYIPLNDVNYAGEKILEVKHISKKGNYRDISFDLHRGEILSITGLVGSGRTETIKALYGLNKPDSGEIYLHGKKVQIHSVVQALKHKIALVPEDRHEEGLILEMKMKENISISILDQLLTKMRFLDEKKINEITEQNIQKLNIKPPQREKKAKNFSGGNQQKIAIAKGIVAEPEILIIDEPTHGVDIGAKAEIHRLLKELAKTGMAIIVVSSEWQEVFAISDRIIIMSRGCVVADVAANGCDKQALMGMAVVGG